MILQRFPRIIYRLLICGGLLICSILLLQFHLKYNSRPKHIIHAKLQEAVQSREECAHLVETFRNESKFSEILRLPNLCPIQGPVNDPPRYVGCFVFAPNSPLLHLVFYNNSQLNSPDHCVRTCRWVGMQFAGLVDASLCYCDHQMPVFALPSTRCHELNCPGDPNENCGSNNSINVYATGVVEQFPKTLQNTSIVEIGDLSLYRVGLPRVVFVLVLTGRDWRQVQRLFRLIYHADNYFYIHVDLNSEYLYSKCRHLATIFPNNVHVTPTRTNPVWGAPGLLNLLISVMKDLMENLSDWHWDFFINLSETDLPIAPLSTLLKILHDHHTQIFVKQASTETFKYVHRQGLTEAFSQCANYVWRSGPRQPLDGVIIHGGSDWVVLPRDFCAYAIYGSDDLVLGLRRWFQNSILPAETFFHTLAYNSRFCDRVVDNNLRLTNWQRPRGCGCKKNTVADWCGCSPSVFSGPSCLKKLHSVNNHSSEALFARKFDATIDVSMINFLERKYLKKHLPDDESLNLHLQSLYNPAFDSKRTSPVVRRAFETIASSALKYFKILSHGCKSPIHQTTDLIQDSLNIFALFNSTRLIGSLNYTAIDSQLDRDGLLSTRLINPELPLRSLAGPNLVLKFGEKTQVLLQRTPESLSEAWLNPKSQRLLTPGDILYFEVTGGFDIKELVSRNYHRYLASTDLLTVVILWRHGAEPSINSVRLYAPSSETRPACSLRVPHNPATVPPFPGAPNILATTIDFHLGEACPGKPLSGQWTAELGGGIKARFRVDDPAVRIWTPVDVCSGERGCLGVMTCDKCPWSTEWPDAKSSLGGYDPSTGLLVLGGRGAESSDVDDDQNNPSIPL